MNIDAKDIRTLQDATRAGSLASSPNAVNGVTRFYYFFPKSDKDINLIQSVLQKYGITSQIHESSLADIPAVRVPLSFKPEEINPNLATVLELFEQPIDLSIQSNRPADFESADEIPKDDASIQRQQIQKLKALTGLDFTFVPADKSPMHVKSYVTPHLSDEAFHKLRENGIYSVGNGDGGLMVVENWFDHARVWNTLRKKANPEKFSWLVTEPIGKINGHDVYLETFRDANSSIVEYDMRAMVVVNINGKSLPFYVSSGLAGKDKKGIPSGHWYPLIGVGKEWFNKMPNMMHNPAPELDQVVELLEAKFPAAQMKPKALNGELPAVSTEPLMLVANKDFPEGVQHDYRGRTPEYTKNIDVYLPAIIHAWRTPAKDYLETRDDIIGRPAYKNLQEIQRKIHAEITETNGMIQFLPNRNMSHQRLRQELENLGIAVDDNLAISVDELMGKRAEHVKERPTPEPVAVPKPQLRKMEQADINALSGMLNQVVAATSPNQVNGTGHFFYFMPKVPGNQDAILAILNKYGLQASPHMTGLNNRAFPIVRMPDTNDAHQYLSELANSTNALISFRKAAQREAARRDLRGQFGEGQNQVHKKGLWQRMVGGLTNFFNNDNKR